ncbi:MAG: energy transducer TonB [Kofleriaceae bacterium]
MRGVGLLLLGCVSCGPGLQAPREAARTASDSFVKAVSERDVTAIGRFFAPELAYGGMYFANAECLQKFPTPTVIRADKQADFASCLATLMLASSERSDEMRTVRVFEYAPGIEIEAKFDASEDGAKLTWIGYSARRGLSDGLPTIAPSALEAFRIEGDPKGTPSPEDAAKLAAEHSDIPNDNAWAWLKICLDADGAITNVHPREASTPLASRVFTEAAQKWKFKPIRLGGTNAVPACSLVRLSHPWIDTPEVIPLAFELPDGAIRVPPSHLQLVAGSKTIIPDDEDKVKIMRAGADGLIGSFMFCFDETGAVNGVRVLDATGLPSYDEKVRRTIATTWKYRPYIFEGKAVGVCTAVTFIYRQT